MALLLLVCRICTLPTQTGDMSELFSEHDPISCHPIEAPCDDGDISSQVTSPLRLHEVARSADTVRTIEGYADCLVLRHYESGSAYQATKVATKPIISAGDGPGQHPTQVCPFSLLRTASPSSVQVVCLPEIVAYLNLGRKVQGERLVPGTCHESDIWPWQ
jgi:hypothetical protein